MVESDVAWRETSVCAGHVLEMFRIYIEREGERGEWKTRVSGWVGDGRRWARRR